jgi:hypothetical protein
LARNPKKALWLSAFPDDQPEATRESCQLANRWVEQLCELAVSSAQKGTAHARPEN